MARRYTGLVSVIAAEDASHQLQPAGSYASFGVYLRRLWERRDYMIHVPAAEMRSRHMNTLFGNLWHLLNPALSIGVYYLIFGVLLNTTRGVDNFITFLSVGVFAFQFTQKSATSGASSLARNASLMRSISFPRAMLPITNVMTEALAFLPGVFVFLIAALLTGEPVRLTWLALIPLMFLQLVFNVGAALIAARANHVLRDVENILPFLFRLLFYGSGVLFNVYAYLERDTLRWLFIANPLFDFLALYRWAVLDMPAKPAEVSAALIWTVVLLLVGTIWFRQGEASYGR